MTIVTRFAPSPTGYLHIGGARTALFNYLYAKHTNGKFLLRIEDTDLERSTPKAIEAIINGLKWLNLTNDDEIVYQLQNKDLHQKLAHKLLDEGKAYKCYCTKEELDQRRKAAETKGEVFSYDGRCSKITDHSLYKDKPFALRLKVNKSGKTTIQDAVLSEVTVENSTIDDFVILRSNGVPTYMFAVVVDDNSMKITHIIRGDDHLTNTFKQYHIYQAFNWNIPVFAHLPLIYASDGKKMSKRKGAASVEEYRDMGFLPEAVKNYLLKLGWSHKDEEIISEENAIKWFDIKDINKSPARFDMVKLASINSHYLKNTENNLLLDLVMPFIEKNLQNKEKHPSYKEFLLKGMGDLKTRSKTLIELADHSMFYVLKSPFDISTEDLGILKNNVSILTEQIGLLSNLQTFDRQSLHDAIKQHAENSNIKLGLAVSGLRILLVGKSQSPASIFDIMNNIGKEETLTRINYKYC